MSFGYHRDHLRWLGSRVLLPLAALAGVAWRLNHYWPDGGFFMNLSAGFVGSIVTVGFIDLLLRAHESSRWAGADTLIAGRIRTHATSIASTVRAAFGIPIDSVVSSDEIDGNVINGQRTVIRFAALKIRPAALAHVSKMNPSQWRSLSTNIAALWRESGEIIGGFGTRLSPEQLALLLSLQDQLSRVNIFYATFPEFAGADPAHLPKSKTPAEELQRCWYQITATAIGDLLDTTQELFEAAAPVESKRP